MFAAERRLVRLRLAAVRCDARVQLAFHRAVVKCGHRVERLDVAGRQAEPCLRGRLHQTASARRFLRRREPYRRDEKTVRISTRSSVSCCSRLASGVASRTPTSTRKNSQMRNSSSLPKRNSRSFVTSTSRATRPRRISCNNRCSPFLR